MATKGERREWINWEFEIKRYATIYKRDNQQGPTTQYRELYSISYNNL